MSSLRPNPSMTELDPRLVARPGPKPDGGSHRAPDPSDPDVIEADIARQRDELAATVAELQAKLDVKARAHEKADELRDRATDADGRPRPEYVAGAGALLAVLLGLVALKVRRARRSD